MKKYHLLILLLIITTQGLFGQTLVTAPLNQANTTGEYYSPTSITLSPGFSTTAGGTFHAYISDCIPLAVALSTDQNYISLYTPKSPFTATTDLTLQSTCDVMQTVKYFDGLGRPLQTVQVKGSPSFHDIVQPFVYDIFGREVRKYLPFAASSSDGSYKTDALTQATGIDAFYNPAGTALQLPNGSPRIATPFAETAFEGSMMDRPVEQGAPGNDWQLGQGHTVKMDYLFNTDADLVLKYATTTAPGDYKPVMPSASEAYAADLLTKTITKGENWQVSDGISGTTEEYKDKEGRVVLKRNYNKNTLGQPETLSTSYVYDVYGNLIFVLPPFNYGDPAQTIPPGLYAAPTQQQLDDICYQYRYDTKNRLIEKKLPGKGWEYMVYNIADQLMMSQDASQRSHANQDWTVVKYDQFGRAVVTGIFTHIGSTPNTAYRATMQTNVDAGSTPNWESYYGNGYGYTNTSGLYTTYPTTVQKTQTVSYYDNYTFPGASALAAQSTVSTKIRGLATGSRVFTTDGTASYLSANYYDDEGKAIESVSENSVGGTDRVISTYSFDGRLLNSIRTHIKPAQANTTIAMEYTYDQVGRKLQSKESINGNPQVILSQLAYNEVGQLMTKQLHSTNGGSTFINTANYTYNERGWLNSINNPDAITASTVFAEALSYNAGSTPQYNGNISGMAWQTMTPAGLGLYQQKQSYAYSYDKLNRLITAKYSDPTVTDKFNEVLDYDQRGNIMHLQRKNSTATGIYLNNFTYNYGSGATLSNKLLGVIDIGTAAQSGTYTYDVNGNVLTDTRNQITGITYNYLNLPDVVTRTPGNISYTYTAGGSKLKKVAGGITRDYVGGIEYNNGTIEFIQTEEGRATPNGSSYIYEYYLKDHLGNTRAAIKQDGTITQVQDYYPFGMDMSPGNAYSLAPLNNYKYNGKEKQETGEYDYGARFYDPLIGRFTSVDPLAEKAPNLTPFRYGFNNPIRFVDPNGAYETDGHFWTVYLMTLMMGMGNDAHKIAQYTEAPDNIMDQDGDVLYSPSTWLDPIKQYNIHALTGGSSASARMMGRTGVRNSTDWEDLGTKLHYFGDSYAHTRMDNPNLMYSQGLGHLSDWQDPDKIAIRPALYREYVRSLVSVLGGRLGFKGNFDTFTFDYVSKSGGSTETNSAIFETEIRIREGVKVFSFEGDQTNSIRDYMSQRNAHFKKNIKYKIVTSTSENYSTDGNGGFGYSGRSTVTTVTTE